MVLGLAGVAAFAVDLPVARSFLTPALFKYRSHLNIFEVFGHGIGALLIVWAIYLLDPGRRWAIPRVLACALAAGGAADLLKFMILRVRPYKIPFPPTVWKSFHQWFPFMSGTSVEHSFPSAHTATAVGLAAALIWLYPRGRPLFIVLAVLVGCQRIVSGCHYTSDVLIGAAAGCFVSVWFLHTGLLPGWFDRWEARWRTK